MPGMTATLTLHVLPFSHPCLTAEAALRLKGLDYERVQLMPGAHQEEIEGRYGIRAAHGAGADGR